MAIVRPEFLGGYAAFIPNRDAFSALELEQRHIPDINQDTIGLLGH